jgi:hypothetical protein
MFYFDEAVTEILANFFFTVTGNVQCLFPAHRRLRGQTI